MRKDAEIKSFYEMMVHEELTDEIIKNLVKNYKRNYTPYYEKLLRYYNQQHDINEKTYYNSKINDEATRVSHPYPSLIVDMHSGYFSGNPIEYVNINNKEEVDYINSRRKIVNEDSLDKSITKKSTIYGKVFTQLFITDDEDTESGYDTIVREEILEPTNAFYIYSTRAYDEVLYAVKFYDYNPIGNINEFGVYELTQSETYIEVYSKYHVKTLKLVGDTITTIQDWELHNFKDIPILLYVNNKEEKSQFVEILSLVDALDDIVTNELIMQSLSANAILHLNLTDENAVLGDVASQYERDIVEAISGSGAVITKNANLDFVTNNGNNQNIIQTKKDILSQIEVHSKIVITNSGNSQYQSGTAIMMQYNRMETVAKEKSTEIIGTIRKRLKLIFSYMNEYENTNFEYKDIEIKLLRTIPEDKLDKLIKMSPFLSRRTIIRESGLAIDVEEELEQIAKEQRENINNITGYDYDQTKIADENTEMMKNYEVDEVVEGE